MTPPLRAAPASEAVAETARDEVFVAEDDRDFREYLTTLLVRRGYRVRALRNGRELLDAVAARIEAQGAPPAVIVADYHMPEVDGIAALEALALLGVAARVVLISAFVDEDTAAWARALGAAGTLAKPFAGHELLAAVQRAASGRPRLSVVRP